MPEPDNALLFTQEAADCMLLSVGKKLSQKTGNNKEGLPPVKKTLKLLPQQPLFV